MALEGNSTPMLALIFMITIEAFWLWGSIEAYQFYVGGKDGWVVHPSEDYNHWSSRNQFQVNDILYFKYKKEEDSVIEVGKEDYENCNTDNPLALVKMDDGNSQIGIHRPGTLYFISGNKQHCHEGQKLLIVVLSDGYSPPLARTTEFEATTRYMAPPRSEGSDVNDTFALVLPIIVAAAFIFSWY